MYLCLDISSKKTGWAKFSNDGKLMKKGNIIPDKDTHPYFRLHYVANQARLLFEGVDELIIEGLYLASFNNKYVVTTLTYLARMSGAVIDRWIGYKDKKPHIYKANSARAVIGINGRSHKAEVQLEILKRYKFASDIKLKEYTTRLNKFIKDYQEEKQLIKNSKKPKAEIQKEQKKAKSRFKYKLEKMSKLIETETGIGEDIADSIVLGLAYYKAKIEKKKS